MRLKGKIINWNDEKGFGFIKPNSGPEIFVHINSFSNQRRRPIDNEFVTFEIRIDEMGRHQAQYVKFDVEKISFPIPTARNLIHLILACCFLITLGYSAYLGNMPKLVFAIYFIASILTFSLYARDKSAAKNGYWRTPESTLHLFSFIGGWPGALVAQTTLRHKSKKKSFRTVFWSTVLINCSVLGWLLSPDGSSVLHNIYTSQSNLKIDKHISLFTTIKKSVICDKNNVCKTTYSDR